MNFSITGLALALFLILPGYLATLLEHWVTPGIKPPRIGDWIAMSVLRSLVLNAVALPLWLVYTGPEQTVPWDDKLADAWWVASSLKLSQVRDYLISLYGLATLQGLLVGMAIKQWKGLSWALRWTSISPYEDVWNDILSENFRNKKNLALRGTPALRRAWLKLALNDGHVIIGRMRRSSITIDKEKPIEVFLAPGYVFNEQCRMVEALGDLTGCDKVGFYLRVSAQTPVEIVSARDDWHPRFTA
jgi:Family of unknown function (DUF6338)